MSRSSTCRCPLFKYPMCGKSAPPARGRSSQRWTCQKLLTQSITQRYLRTQNNQRSLHRAVSSPHYCLIFTFRNSQPPAGISVTSYADDCTILTSGNGIDGMCSKVNSYLSDLSRFFSARSLTLSPTKSTATIFTNWTKEYRLNISVDGTKIPTVNNPKILGVTLDSLCSCVDDNQAITCYRSGDQITVTTTTTPISAQNKNHLPLLLQLPSRNSWPWLFIFLTTAGNLQTSQYNGVLVLLLYKSVAGESLFIQEV